MDHHGATHTIPEQDWESRKWKNFVYDTFNPYHCVPDTDTDIAGVKMTNRGLRLFDELGRIMFRGIHRHEDDLYRQNRKYQQKENHSIHHVGESFLFYRKHPQKANGYGSSSYLGGGGGLDGELQMHENNAIALNELVVDNHNFDMNMFINNVIVCMYNYERFNKLFEDMMKKIQLLRPENACGSNEEEEKKKALEKALQSDDKFKFLVPGYIIRTSGDEVWNEQNDGFTIIPSEEYLYGEKSIQRCPKRWAFKSQEQVCLRILDAVVAGLDALIMPLMVSNGKKELDNDMLQRFKNVVHILRLFPNPGYSLVPNMLNLINPGWSFNWLLELLVEDEAFVMSRPASYINVKTIPVTNRTEHREVDLVDYTMQQSLAIHKQSLNFGSIIDPHAYFAKSITRTTAFCLGPEEFAEYDWSKNYSILYSGYADNETTDSDDQDTEMSPWIPLVAAPCQSSNYWSSQMSPMGRLAGHYESQEDFNNRFYNLAENDIMHTGVYTMNTVWTNMNVNINRCLLIEPETYSNKNFPLYKYVKYNHASTMRNNSFRNNAARVNRTKTYAAMDDEVSSSTFSAEIPILSKLYSTVRGVAMPKHCATTADQISPKTVEEAKSARRSGVIHNSKINIHDYRITGSICLEKFDKNGVNHYTFY